MCRGAIYLCVRVYLTSSESEARIAAPVAIALGAYFVIKSVLSQSQNQFIMYAFVGVALALNYRFYREASKQRADPRQLPFNKRFDPRPDRKSTRLNSSH